MKILVIDERKGDCLRPDQEKQFRNADYVFVIQADGHMTTKKARKKGDHSAVYIEAVHRDVISGEKSAEAYAEIEAHRDMGDAGAEDPVKDKFPRSFTGPSNSGTETITGAL